MGIWDDKTQDPPLAFYEIQARLGSVSAAVKRIAAGEVSFCFVGHDAANARVVVCRTDQDSPVGEDDYRAVIPTWAGIAFSHAVLNLAQIAELEALTRDTIDWLAERGIDVAGFGGPNAEDDANGLLAGGYFQIDYEGDTEPTAEVVARFNRFGPGTVRFESGGIELLV